MIIKRDGRREPFSQEKLENSLVVACAKRPLEVGKISRIVVDIETELNSIPLGEPSFNDLMELKDILIQYYPKDQPEEQKLFRHFLNAELLVRQRKTSEAIEELHFLVEQYPDAEISSLAILRQALLFQRIQRYDDALLLAHSLEETKMADRGIILSGQIYELYMGEIEKALAAYMKILNEYPSSIFVEPVRYHIRKIQQEKS